MIVIDAKLSQPLVNIEKLEIGSYILYNGLIGIIFPFKNWDDEELSYTIHILNENKLSNVDNKDFNIRIPKCTKVIPVKINTLEYEVIK